METLSPQTGRLLISGYKLTAQVALKEKIVRDLYDSKEDLERLIQDFAKENVHKCKDRLAVKYTKQHMHKTLVKHLRGPFGDLEFMSRMDSGSLPDPKL